MKQIELIKALSNAPGVSGFEDEVVKTAKSYLEDSFDLEEDRLRNLFIHASKQNQHLPRVMLDAHSDEVGFMVQSINSNGTLKFLPLGGWNPQVVSAQPVAIRNTKGRWIKGVVASKPTHFMTPEEQKAPASLNAMVLDVGAVSKQEVLETFHIGIGAPVVPDVDFFFDKKTGLMMGKAFDDRLGCAALLEIMKHHVTKNCPLDVHGVLSSQEEVGLRGVNVSVRKINPDVAIVLEGTPADDTFSSSDVIQAALKKGPQIRHMDNSVLCNPRFVRFAIDIAKKNDIKFQEAVRSGGGNNGSVITLHDRGIPTITLGIPVRYIHTHHAIAALEDFNLTIQWCSEILKHLTREVIEGF